MTVSTYIINSILCSAVFLLTYHLLLEKVKMHVFNRFYLLLSLLFCFIIPLFTFTFSHPGLEEFQRAYSAPVNLIITDQSPVLTPDKEAHYGMTLLIIIYTTISALLLFRFVRNLRKLSILVLSHPHISFRNATIVLLQENRTPHSFLNYLFLHEEEYSSIEKEILEHEYAHIQQKHSYDILWLELLQIVFWFNPTLPLFKRAIQLKWLLIHNSKMH